MKKIFFLLFILVGCIEDPEIRTTKGAATHDIGSDPTALLPCELDYKWFHDGTQSTPYLINGYYNGTNWYVILNPQWTSGGSGPLYYFPSLDNIVFKMRVRNAGGQTFRYRIDGGTWVTLASGQSGIAFTRTAWGHTPCDNNNAIGPVFFELDIERLTCGNPPYTMQMSLDCISVSNGHNYGTPNGAINQPILGGIFSGTSCNI
jgi:hypothetical protein